LDTAKLLHPSDFTGTFGCHGGVDQATLQSSKEAAERQVAIPQRIWRALAAGPAASILLYTLAAEKMTG
jgi:hypothetical protein